MRRLVTVLFLSTYFLLLHSPMVSAQFQEAGVEKFRVAVEAPEFTLRELDGGKVSLRELKGKVVLLNFFAPY